MKRILLLLLVVFQLSCSTDSGNDESEVSNAIQWTITTTNICSDSSTNTYTTYCVTESVYKSVTEKWTSTGSERNCSKISFSDINGTSVNEIIANTKKSKGACNNIND